MFSFETIFHWGKKKKDAIFVKNPFLTVRKKKKKKDILKGNFQSAISKDWGVGEVPQRAGEQLKRVGGACEGAWRNIREQHHCITKD